MELTRTEVEASAEQLPDEVFGIVRGGITAPGDVLIGARNNELVIAGRLRSAAGNIDDRERDAVRAHRIGQWRNRNIRIVAQQGIARPERVIDGPSVGQLRERNAASRRRSTA